MMPHHKLHQFASMVAIGCACASNSAWAPWGERQTALAGYLLCNGPDRQGCRRDLINWGERLKARPILQTRHVTDSPY